MAALGFFGLLIGGYAAALLYELNAGDLARDWMQSRARAEQLRSEYFDRLVAHAATADSRTQDAALDLVTKHLLQDQLNYFAKRGKRHEAAAGHWLRLAAFATGVASVGVAAGGMVGAVGGPWLLAVAALGAIGTAVVSFATSQEAIGQERERAQRFRNDVDALELVARQIDDVRGAIGRGSAEALVTFTAAINQQLALELGRFLEGGESIRASITKLSQQIEKSREGKEDGAPEAPGSADQGLVPGKSDRALSSVCSRIRSTGKRKPHSAEFDGLTQPRDSRSGRTDLARCSPPRSARAASRVCTPILNGTHVDELFVNVNGELC